MSLSLRAIAAAAVTAATMGAAAAQAPSVDEIIAKNLRAKGGVEKLKALTTARITGRVKAPAGEASLVTLSKRPNLMRREVTLPGDKKLVTGFDGTTVWAMDPSGVPQAITGAQGEAAKEDAQFDSVFVDYKQKGHRIELVGNETIDGRPVHHLKMTTKSGKVQHHYIDVEDGLERRVVSVMEQGPQRAELVMELSDHREVDGLTVPFSMRQSVDGREIARISIDKVEFNVPLEDGVFLMPAAKQ